MPLLWRSFLLSTTTRSPATPSSACWRAWASPPPAPPSALANGPRHRREHLFHRLDELAKHDRLEQPVGESRFRTRIDVLVVAVPGEGDPRGALRQADRFHHLGARPVRQADVAD